MWKSINDELPPTGDCSKNILLLWTKCPDEIPYPEYYKGYQLGFYDKFHTGIFFDDKYRHRIDNVTHWMLLPTNPNITLGEKDGVK